MTHLPRLIMTCLSMLLLSSTAAWADDFIVERAVGLAQMDSWADISRFQWQEIDHGIQDNKEEMEALINLFYDPAPKDTVGFYNQIYQARDNQYIVLRLDKAKGKRPFYVKVTVTQSAANTSRSTTKLYTAENYVYIMPPIGETQLEVKIWPQGEGEETAKSYTFNGHSYGSLSVRSVMLDKSRIVPGDYDLQLIHYDSKTEKSDTSYICDLQPDKLYTFYTYDKGDLVEAYLMADHFKRIKLQTDSWARDVVTHVSDNSVTVMTGPKMPYRQHKRLDAPNPTYLDSRLFSHHDTLWVNLYLDNIPSHDANGLTMNAVLADFDNNPTGDHLLTWGKDPLTQRLYILTDGEPCTIECYRDGYLPKLTMYPGSYDHMTGVISGQSEEVDIYLEPLAAPITSPTATSAVLSTLTPTLDCRGNYYVSSIQEADILPFMLNEYIPYDEYGSHKDTMKIANGMMLESYVKLKVAVVAPYNAQNTGVVTLKKAETAEENAILKESLDGKSTGIYSSFFDYSYWASDFDLREYLAPNTFGRPAIAFDGTIVRQLPILANVFIDTEEMKRETTDALKEEFNGNEATDEGNKWISAVDPNGNTGFNARVPLVMPFYTRVALDLDFFRAKKLSLSVAFGAGFFQDFIKGQNNFDDEYWKKMKVTVGNSDMNGTGEAIDLSNAFNDIDKDEDSKIFEPSITAEAWAEAYVKLSVPYLDLITGKGRTWKQWTLGLSFIDEIGVRGELNAGISARFDLTQLFTGLAANYSNCPPFLSDLAGYYSKVGGNFLKEIFGVQLTGGLGLAVNVNLGIFSFKNESQDFAPWKTHIIGLRFFGQAYANLQLKAKVNLMSLASVDAGITGGAGINFKYAGGSRLDFRKKFSGSAYSWYAGFGVYCKIKALGWSKYFPAELGRLEPQQRLIVPKNYENPFSKNFTKYLSGLDDPDEKKSVSHRAFGNAKTSLPGTFMTDLVDFGQPVKFIAGGDSIIYQGAYENPNDYCVEVASTGAPIYLSDYRLGGCTGYDAASVPGTDLVVLEQATGQISQEDLEDSLKLDKTVNRASRVYSVYYTKKHAGTKWYKPKPIYSSTETTSFQPRVAVADNGTGVAIWQEGLIDKGSWVGANDTVQLSDLVMTGHLMLSRFDGNETWSAPVPLMAVNGSCTLKDYSVTYDGSTAFIIARKATGENSYENICMTVDAANHITTLPLDHSSELMRIRRVDNHNLLAWVAPTDSSELSSCFYVKSYGMDGKPDNAINTMLILNKTKVEEFRIVPDLQAKSMNNVALLWKERSLSNDSTTTQLMASRLVPQQDGSFGLGTPITTVRLSDANTIYGFDGYMTDEKMQVCYIAVDSLGYSQLNKTAAYFGNAFSYTVAFDTDNNQAFQCDKDEITLLITVNNHGTSTINECVLTIANQQYPLDMTIPAGTSAQQRVVIPYKIGTGVNTTLNVKYDDVLGIQEKSYARYLARKRDRLNGRRAATLTAEEKAEDATYEKHTAMFFPYRPRLECFVVAQRVDKNGDNYITICVRNHTRRSLVGDFAIIVGLKEHPYSSFAYKGTGQSDYETKMLFSNAADMREGDSYMKDYGSYRAGYVTIKVSGVSDKKDMYVGGTLIYKEPNTGLYIRLIPQTYSGSDNCGVVTLYPTSEAAAVEKVYSNDDTQAHLHVSHQAGQLVVTGAKAGQQVRLYEASGVIIARCQADQNGRATFTAPSISGVGLVSSDKETVKFVY